MTNKKLISKQSLFIAAAVTAGFGIVASPAQAASVPQGFSVDSGNPTLKHTANWETNNTTYELASCNDGDVVQSWIVEEKNKADFRKSAIHCVPIDPDTGGMILGDAYASNSLEHFDYDTSGDFLNATIGEDDRLPVGVRLRWKSEQKVVDFGLRKQHPEDIIDNTGGVTSTDWATEQDGSDERTVNCPAGEVLTGINIREKANSGGANSSEIQGVEIECAELLYNPSPVAVQGTAPRPGNVELAQQR